MPTETNRNTNVTTRAIATIAIALLAIACCGYTKAAEPTSKQSIKPATNWRVQPHKIYSTGTNDIADATKEKRYAAWTTTVSSQKPATLLFTLPRDQKGPVLLTYRYNNQRIPIMVHLASVAPIPNINNLEQLPDNIFKNTETQIPTSYLDKFELTPLPAAVYRMSVTLPDNIPGPANIKITDISFRDLSGQQRKDYWLILGASIQAQSIRNYPFGEIAKEKFKNADPVVFNTAIPGWKTDDVLNALPGFLKQHPHASYVCIHIGGNNVSAGRPYPGGADTIRKELETILTTITEAGKIPILSRLSYRAYNGTNAVPPEENGSGPYVTNIYDPLIKKYCPLFYDEQNNRGRVDAYNWFKNHPEELSPDGIHVNRTGQQSWNRLWVEQAGSVVYNAD